MAKEQLLEDSDLVRRSFVTETQEYHALVWLAVSKDPVSKVLVVRDQNALLSYSEPQHLFVGRTSGLMEDGINIMPL